MVKRPRKLAILEEESLILMVNTSPMHKNTIKLNKMTDAPKLSIFLAYCDVLWTHRLPRHWKKTPVFKSWLTHCPDQMSHTLLLTFNLCFIFNSADFHSVQLYFNTDNSAGPNVRHGFSAFRSSGVL